MKAGRELDALIAEKVMGMTITWGFFSEDVYAKELEGRRVPPFSTDIAAAFQVVAAMKADIIEMLWHCDAEAWIVTFNDRHGPAAKELPLAICLSALPRAWDQPHG